MADKKNSLQNIQNNMVASSNGNDQQVIGNLFITEGFRKMMVNIDPNTLQISINNAINEIIQMNFKNSQELGQKILEMVGQEIINLSKNICEALNEIRNNMNILQDKCSQFWNEEKKEVEVLSNSYSNLNNTNQNIVEGLKQMKNADDMKNTAINNINEKLDSTQQYLDQIGNEVIKNSKSINQIVENINQKVEKKVNELDKKINSNSNKIENEKKRNDEMNELVKNKINKEITNLTQTIKNIKGLDTKDKNKIETQIKEIINDFKKDNKNNNNDKKFAEINKKIEGLEEIVYEINEQMFLNIEYEERKNNDFDEEDKNENVENIKIGNNYTKNNSEKEKKYKLIIDKNVFIFKDITKNCGSEDDEKELVDNIKVVFKNAVVEDDIIYEISTLCKDWDFDKYVKDKFNSVKRSRNIVKVNTNRLDTIYELQWSEKQIQFISKEATMKYVNNHGFFVKRGNSMIYVKRLNNSFKNYSRRKFFRYNKFSKKNNQKKNKFKNNNNNLFNLNKNKKSVSEGLINNRNINGKRIQYNGYKSTPFINRSINSYSGGYRRRPFINRKPYQFNNRRSYNNFGNNTKFIGNRNFRY